MFAVPGWSVSASSLKRQTEADVRRESAGGADAPSKNSRKRKRKSKTVTDDSKGNDSDHANEQRSLSQSKSSGVLESGPPKSKRPKNESHSQQNGAPSPEPRGINHLSSGSTGSAEPSKKQRKSKDPEESTASRPQAPPPPTHTAAAAKALTPLQQKMRDKLISARFRHLNETLYTAPSQTSLDLFADNPSMFEDYHSGFRRQVAVWPENPVDAFIRTVTARAKVRPAFSGGKGRDRRPRPKNDGEAVAAGPDPLPRTGPVCTVADLGCGDATIARTLAESGVAKKRNVKVLSYDLAAPNEFVTKADVAALPLKDGAVDVAVFCLALMGTNWLDFVEEAYRVLRWKGELWVAEIKSRFARPGKGKGGVVEHSVGKRRKGAAGVGGKKEDQKRAREEEEEQEVALKVVVDGDDAAAKEETDVAGFVAALERRGFVLRKGQESVDLGNKMFVRMEFVKAQPPVVGKNVREDQRESKAGKKRFLEAPEVDVADEAKVLKPCLYKIR